MPEGTFPVQAVNSIQGVAVSPKILDAPVAAPHIDTDSDKQYNAQQTLSTAGIAYQVDFMSLRDLPSPVLPDSPHVRADHGVNAHHGSVGRFRGSRPRSDMCPSDICRPE